jgi:hypothetical protein
MGAEGARSQAAGGGLWVGGSFLAYSPEPIANRRENSNLLNLLDSPHHSSRFGR